jgi:hypothetical protein
MTSEYDALHLILKSMHSILRFVKFLMIIITSDTIR